MSKKITAVPPKMELHNKEIAEEFKTILKQLAVEFNISEDEVRRRVSLQHVTKKRDSFRCRDQVILRLRQAGYHNDQITEVIGRSYSIVASVACQFIQKGLLERQSRGRRAELSFCYNLEDKRTQTIIKMMGDRETYKVIGTALGVTGNRIGQVVRQMRGIHGSEIFAPSVTFWTVPEAAAELGVSWDLIWRICRSGEIPCRKRSGGHKGYWRIEEAGMAALRKHRLITKERNCVVCGAVFVAAYQGEASCSEKCKKEREYQRCRRHLETYAKQKPTLASLSEWHRDLWQQLQTHRLPEDETWLTISEARRITGLSNMKLSWLRMRNIVTIHRNPSRIARKTGKPMALYAASEMELARQVYADYKCAVSKRT